MMTRVAGIASANMRTLSSIWLLSISLAVACLSLGCSHFMGSCQERANVTEADFIGSWEGEGVRVWRTNTFCRLDLLPGGGGVCVENYSDEWPKTTTYRITSWHVNQWGRLLGRMSEVGKASPMPARLVGWLDRRGMNFSISWSVEGGSIAHLERVPALKDQMRAQAQRVRESSGVGIQ